MSAAEDAEKVKTRRPRYRSARAGFTPARAGITMSAAEDAEKKKEMTRP